MNLLKAVLYFLFPPTCGFCEKYTKDFLCYSCASKLRKLEIGKRKLYIEREGRYFGEHMYIFQYTGKVKEVIREYKFHNKPYLYHTFSKIILNNVKICGFLKKYDIIVPVPIHLKRKRKRGYNQTELIAKELAKEITNLSFEDIIYKKIDTKAQSQLDGRERRRNLYNVYLIKNKQTIQNKKVVLFDDIYTTGSTVNECSRMLKLAGAKEVGILTIAKD